MKITIIHGSPRKGNTYAATQVLKDEMAKHGQVEWVEFFMPQDLPDFCRGCENCFRYGENKCPQSSKTLPMLEQMISSDGLIITTPVFVMRETAAIKNFLDHYAWIFIVHRAHPSMFSKKALILSSTVGAGTKDAIKAVKISLKFWGVNKIDSFAFKTFGDRWNEMKAKKKDKIAGQIQNKAKAFHKEVASGKKHRPYPIFWLIYHVRRHIMRKANEDSLDSRYWQKMGWLSGDKKPF